MTETAAPNPEPLELNEEDIGFILSSIQKGFTPAQVTGFDQEKLEALYAVGHRLYSTGEFKDAETAFRSLCLFDYNDSRYWMGLGAALQAQDKLALAIEVYGMAGLASLLNDPAPFYYAGLCHLKSGDFESADACFSALEIMGEAGDAKADAVKAKAANLRAVIKEKLAGAPANQEEGK
jgi:type III secretion system low calcium response chaperone LcrH/SycD